MVESVKEIRKICSKETKERGLMLIYREISFYLTKVLLYTHLSANQVSILSMVIGIFGSVLFIFGSLYISFIGVLLLFLWHIGDYCDGNVARYRGVSGGIGGELDWLNIRVVPHVLFICLSIGVYNQLGDVKVLILGFSLVLLWFITSTYKGLVHIVHSILAIDERLKTVKVQNVFPKRVFMMMISLSQILNRVISNILGNSRFIAFKNTSPKKIDLNGMTYRWIFNTKLYTKLLKKKNSRSVRIYVFMKELSKPIYISVYLTLTIVGEIIFQNITRSDVTIYGMNFTYMLMIYLMIIYIISWIYELYVIGLEARA